MVRYIDEHKDRFGVEPICAVLLIARVLSANAVRSCRGAPRLHYLVQLGKVIEIRDISQAPLARARRTGAC
jgi:hypothetical protein